MTHPGIDRRNGSPGLMWIVIAGLLLTAETSGCNTSTESEEARSPEKPTTSEIHFRRVPVENLEGHSYQNGRAAATNSILEIVGGGAACLDFDLDGYCDLFLPGGGIIDAEANDVRGVASVMFRCGPHWEFEQLPATAGIGVSELYSHGAAVADYNHDGFDDLLVTGYDGVRLLQNQGDGSFSDVTEAAGLDAAHWTTSAAWADLNRDSHLDLYLVSYVDWKLAENIVCPTPKGLPDVCSPNAYPAKVDMVFYNSGDGTFAQQINPGDPKTLGKGLGVGIGRGSVDQELAVVVANDQTPNFFLRFSESGVLENGFSAGIAVDAFGNVNGSMGVEIFDFDLDQDFDILITNFHTEQIALYENNGPGFYQHVSQRTGLAAAPQVVGFGVAASDFDCDGDEDVVLTAGHVHYRPDRGSLRQTPLILENQGGKRFVQTLVESESYFAEQWIGRGLAAADFDNDGDQDLVVTHLDEPPALLENDRRNRNSWSRVRLVGTQSCRTPIGAIVTATTPGGKQVRQLVGGRSYLSHSQNEIFFGWDEGNLSRLEIAWPSGAVSTLEDVAADQVLLVVEPQ